MDSLDRQYKHTYTLVLFINKKSKSTDCRPDPDHKKLKTICFRNRIFLNPFRLVGQAVCIITRRVLERFHTNTQVGSNGDTLPFLPSTDYAIAFL